MKKITLIFALFLTIFSFSTASAQKNARVPYNKDVAQTFVEEERSIQIYLSSEWFGTSVKYDTAIAADKHGRAVTTITSHTTTIKIRNKEKGRVVEWRGDTCFVEFSNTDKELTTLPFVKTASGKHNNLALLLTTISGKQINGDPIYYPAGSRKVTLADSDGEDAVFNFSGDRPILEYIPVTKKPARGKEGYIERCENYQVALTGKNTKTAMHIMMQRGLFLYLKKGILTP
jgi:hypothetical protein